MLPTEEEGSQSRGLGPSKRRALSANYPRGDSQVRYVMYCVVRETVPAIVMRLTWIVS